MCFVLWRCCCHQECHNAVVLLCSVALVGCMICGSMLVDAVQPLTLLVSRLSLVLGLSLASRWCWLVVGVMCCVRLVLSCWCEWLLLGVGLCVFCCWAVCFMSGLLDCLVECSIFTARVSDIIFHVDCC